MPFYRMKTIPRRRHASLRTQCPVREQADRASSHLAEPLVFSPRALRVHMGGSISSICIIRYREIRTQTDMCVIIYTFAEEPS